VEYVTEYILSKTKSCK